MHPDKKKTESKRRERSPSGMLSSVIFHCVLFTMCVQGSPRAVRCPYQGGLSSWEGAGWRDRGSVVSIQHYLLVITVITVAVVGPVEVKRSANVANLFHVTEIFSIISSRKAQNVQDPGCRTIVDAIKLNSAPVTAETYFNHLISIHQPCLMSLEERRTRRA